jgi:hypothetical protein
MGEFMAAKKSAAAESVASDTLVTTTPTFKNIHDKLVHVRKNVGNIEKSKTNTHLRYEYRTEDDYYNTIRPLLDEVGVMLYVSTTNAHIDGGYVYVTMEYVYVDTDSGERVSAGAMGMGDLKDGTGIKKAQTGAARYHFQKMFLVADGEDDEADVGRPARSQGAPARPAAQSSAPVEQIVTGKLLGIRSAVSNRTNKEYTYLAYTVGDSPTVLRHIFKTGEATLQQILSNVNAGPTSRGYDSETPVEFDPIIPCTLTINRTGAYPIVTRFTSR